MVTHQDEMAEVELPSFVVEKSSTIARFSHFITVHINVVSEGANLYRYELRYMGKGIGENIEGI